MTLLTRKITERYFTEILLGASLALNLLFQVGLISQLGDKSVLLIFGLNLGLLLIVVQYLLLPKSHIFLVSLTFLPLIYINNQFHYVFKIEVALNFFLYLLFLLAVAKYFFEGSVFEIKFSGFQKIILLFTALAVLSSIYGLAQGYGKQRVVMEFYHYFYYFFALVFFYLFRERRDYLFVLKVLALIFILVSISHILLFIISGGGRFVSYQSNFTPFIIGFFYGYLLLGDKLQGKILSFILLVPLLIGEALTLTRGLWVTTLIVLATITFVYLFTYKGWKARIIFTFVVVALTFMLFLQSDVQEQSNTTGVPNENIEYRSQSILSPGEDTSFLMRVEFGYYTFVEFMSSPVWGKGIGDELRYKIFSNVVNADLPKSYPDNSYLYFLWKQGIIGFFVFIWMFIRFFRLSNLIYKKSDNIIIKIIGLAIIGGLVGTAANGLLTAVLIKYKLNLIFAFLFAFVEYESRKILKSGDE